MIQAAFPMPKFGIVESYPQSLQTLIHQLQNITFLSPEQVKDLVQATQIQTEELRHWADFDHPIADSYGRQLVFDGGHFEIMVMSWLPGDFSAIHDHGATQWGAVQCFGAAEHYVYQFADCVLSPLHPAHYEPGQVRAVDRDLIHQMGNAGREPFLSLHVYGCATAAGTITGNARVFDLFNGEIQYTDGGVFFGLPETAINDRAPGLWADRETTLRHHRLMGDRLRRRLASQNDRELIRQLTHLQTAIQHLSAG